MHLLKIGLNEKSSWERSTITPPTPSLRLTRAQQHTQARTHSPPFISAQHGRHQMCNTCQTPLIDFLGVTSVKKRNGRSGGIDGVGFFCFFLCVRYKIRKETRNMDGGNHKQVNSLLPAVTSTRPICPSVHPPPPPQDRSTSPHTHTHARMSSSLQGMLCFICRGVRVIGGGGGRRQR